MIFLGDFSFVRIFLKNYRVTMTTTLDTSCSENTMVLSARRGVSACMYFLVSWYRPPNSPAEIFDKFEVMIRNLEAEDKEYHIVGDLIVIY